ncbi:MAG TPA: putative LPS assembly protein LptD [Longimicrobiaceae bacterium]|nr:putative LPS assembly protein LptD [Longimicrobiaceae bacterium]
MRYVREGRGRGRAAPYVLASVLLLAPGALGAQQPTLRVPVARADTVGRDTAARDTSQKPAPTAASAAADSVVGVLQALPGYTATVYQGEEATYRTDTGVLRLHGGAEVNREGNELTADTIVYRQKSQLVSAFGNPKVAGQQQELQGHVLYYDLAHHRASVLGARTQVTESATWYVTGNISAENLTNTVYATNGDFTTCNLAIPHYHFEAGKVKVVKDKYLVGRPAVVYFGKVPVMALPFIVQPLSPGRRSGLIMPSFGLTDIVRTSRNHNRQIDRLGYYWAINDYLGAQLLTTWRSDAYTSLLGQLDYSWRRRFLNGSFAFSQNWPAGGGSNFTLRSNTSWQPDERTSLSVSGNYATSTAFVRNATVDPREQTEDLTSNLSLNRRFDWGTVAFGSSIRQSIANGSSSMQLPTFSISPNPITLFRAASPEQARWFSNSTFTWSLNGSRSAQLKQPGTQDNINSNLQGSSSFRIGDLSLSFNGSTQQQSFKELVLQKDSLRGILKDTTFRARDLDRAQWSSAISYQVKLFGQTSVSPTVSFNQDFLRNTAIGQQAGPWLPGFVDRYTAGPVRTSFGASLNTALFGFYPGFGPFSRIRHRITPSFSYSYSPAVSQTPAQDIVFGEIQSLARNQITIGINQTWEAKLKAPKEPPKAPARGDSTAADSARSTQASVPAEPEKVTLLSINTSAVTYDFVRASHGMSGFTTTTLSNTITSDYLHGISVNMTHELFDQSSIDRSVPGNEGRLGKFSPRLTSLSTGLTLGPDSWLFRWLRPGPKTPTDKTAQGVMPGPPQEDLANPPGSGSFTGNPQTAGHGPWSISLQYSFNRPPRVYHSTVFDTTALRGSTLDLAALGYDRPYSLATATGAASQTITANMAFGLTPNWAVTWATSYSTTDHAFAYHRLNFSRNLHRWQANFSYYLTPNGNSMFSFSAQLIDNADLHVDYNQDYRAIDQRR